MNIRRALEDLLDTQPYRQDYFESIVEGWEEMERVIQRAPHANAGMCNFRVGAPIAICTPGNCVWTRLSGGER